MRKIESLMNAAIAQGKDWKNANTEVRMVGDVAEVYLHGNLISKIGEGFVQLFDGGWQSNTTKSRLNAILDANGCSGEGVFQKDWTWFVRVYQGRNEFATVPFFSGMRLN